MTGNNRLRAGSSGHTRKLEYNQYVKRAEQELAAAQRALEEQQQQYEQSVEKNIILAELVYVQERATAIYEKQKRWLAAGGPTGQENQQQMHQQVQQQEVGAHWVLHLLETATWKQLQLALSYDCEQWQMYLNRYFEKLCFLSEINRRDPQMQVALMQAAGITPHPNIPAIYTYTSFHEGTMTPAWAALLEAMQKEGSLVFLALLHGKHTLFEAASMNAVTRQRCEAPPLHWVKLAKRMRFTRQQKLHFRLALENFARQSKAAAARGLNLLKETPSYAFLLACETIAARNASNGSGLSPSSDPTPKPSAAAAAAAVADLEASLQHPSSEAAGPISSSGRMTVTPDTYWIKEDSPDAKVDVSMFNSAAKPEAAAPSSDAGHPGEAMSVDEELQRHIAMYFRSIVFLNIFLTDTLTLEQGLLMNMGAFPYWPMLSAIAEAAIQLPDEDEPAGSCHLLNGDHEVPTQGIELLMQQRRLNMAEVHDDLLATLARQINIC